MTQPRLLLFDLGNVLVKFEPDKFSRALGLDPSASRYHYESTVRDLTNKFECGKYSTNEYFALLRKHLNNRFEEPILREAFLSVLTDPIPGMEDLVRTSTARLPAALVSNTNEYHFSSVLPRIHALDCLPRRYLSYQLGVIKPLPEFYERVKAREKVKPEEMLFIDDVEKNIEAAARAGIPGHLFHGVEGLDKHLKSLGVL
jgi:HAD superfamily hydrolase (TIGR01509 family)